MPKDALQEIALEKPIAEWLDRLRVVVDAIEQMGERERLSAFTYIKSRYAKFWPPDSY